ncbi:MAG: hypothetical protein QM311_08635 [Acidobacteriota bacterium]|nr:hypothetical protein [Acidobacteriota bacterium]
MRLPHLFSVDAEPEAFATLWRLAAAHGIRIGWLDLASESAPPAPVTMALTAGAAKVVAVSGRQTLAGKRLAGPPVLRDLVREHFLGCQALLVRGRVGYPRLLPGDDGYQIVEMAGAEPQRLDTKALLRRLRRPRSRG